ncbi:transcriptional regulator [Amylibacter ulvae]|uniref:Transcriptional regulator n=1 Tax=Paramylibacter ulvae TaxID=1651968 RepID=A0ABQ3CSR5_9RHOB|nr:PLP-dependent aminotransferase family protein [Amylibacter ulvae]GHA41683.1 transcriptional regulator [Amylibacter ulvae]
MKKQQGALLTSIHIDRTARKKIGVQLYMGLRDIILTGGLCAGDRLPATRTLAKEIQVSRTTVIDAIDRLVAEGLLESRVGAGTYVSEILENQRPRTPNVDTADTSNARPRLAHNLTHATETYAPRSWLPHTTGAFVTALPALDAFPMAHWARLSARHLRGSRDDIMGYGQPKGLLQLRQAIATHLNASRGIRCHSEQVFITAGAQQAFSLIGTVLLNAGDQVWYENPGAAGARNAFLSRGAQMVPIDVDKDGMNVAQGIQKSPHFRLAFVTPSHQQPLGHVMSLARRLELLDAANTAQAMIVEDDYDGDFYFGGQPHPPLKSIDTQGRVIYVGTFSKTLFPSLRLGFMLVPDGLIDTFDHLFASWISTAPTSVQSIVADFMDEGHFSTHIRMMRRLYSARYDAMIEASSQMPNGFTLGETKSGFHTMGYLPENADEHKLVRAAGENGVIVAPLNRYCLTPIQQKGLVLGFGSSTPEQINSGMKTLRKLVRRQI